MANQMVSEHAAIAEEKKPQSPAALGEQSTVKKVNELMMRSKKATKDIREEWSRNYDFVVKGRQWDVRRPRWRFSEVINITWADIMTEVGIQTDGRPKVDFQAAEPSDFQFAEVLKEINDVNWEKPKNMGFGWLSKTTSQIFKSKLYHVVHTEITWDRELSGGIGDVSYKCLDPFGCFWDPVAKDIWDARYFIYAEPVPIQELKKKYPDKAEKIKADVSAFGNFSEQKPLSEYNQDLDFASSGPLSQLHGEPNDRMKGSRHEFGGEEMALLMRVWIRDDETLEELVEGKDGEQEYITRLKYPKGRYLEVVNKCVLKDEGENGEADPEDPNIFEDKMFPIATLVNYDYGEYIGENEVTHKKGIQKLTNYVASHIMDQFKMGSNPQKIVSARAQDVAKKLTNEPGLVVTVPDVNDVRYETGPGIASGSFNLLDTTISLGDKVGGLQDVSRGASQPGVTSGLMLEGFVEASQTRPRLKNRSVDDYLTQIGYLMASRYLEFYTAPRTFRVTNKEGFPEFVEFFIEKDQEGNRLASVNRMDQKGSPLQGARQQLSAKGIPDVKPVSGSNLPFARAQKTATALDLHSRGAITLESLLDSINWPNAKEEVEKVKKEQAEMAAQMQEAPPQ